MPWLILIGLVGYFALKKPKQDPSQLGPLRPIPTDQPPVWDYDNKF